MSGLPLICAAFWISSHASSVLLFAINQRADFGKTLKNIKLLFTVLHHEERDKHDSKIGQSAFL